MKLNQKGMTLAEVLVSLLLVSVVIFAAIAFMSTAYRSTRHNQEKEFAVQKAISILDELKSFVENNAAGGLVLDNFDQSGQTVAQAEPFTLLTINTTVNPDDPISGNKQLGTDWMYLRQITVATIGEDENRLVNVKIFIKKPNEAIRLMAEVAGVLRTIAPAYSPTQVHDVYMLAIDNVPGWWVYMSNIVPFVTSTLQDLQGRNPGLEFRTHWITKSSYGRNFHYRPYVNNTSDSTADINYVYFYPGLMPTGSAVQYYYQWDRMDARINVDGTTRNDYDATTNQFPYALADNYNNAMRYPDELALFNSRVGNGKENVNEPTFRLLMEDMFLDPEKYRNAIFVNLHGEMFPFPPIRNYSDAAKDPDTFNVLADGYPRAVTHPENLRYDNSDVVKLRVYSYLTDPTKNMQWLNVPIVVKLKGITWTPTGAVGNRVAVITGGVDHDGNSLPDDYVAATAALSGPSANFPYAQVSTSAGDTIIELYKSPVRTPKVNDRGLDPAWQLYDMDYIPSPQEDFVTSPGATPFSIDLFTNDTPSTIGRPKNTARWILEIPDTVLPDDSMITIETRINSTTSGVPFPANAPDNLSKTYAWRGTDLWIFGDNDGDFDDPPHLPITERFQTIGDPRHLPYADLKRVYWNGTTLNPLGTGFNRYFDDFQAGGASWGDGTPPVGADAEWAGWQYQQTVPLQSHTHGVKNLDGDDDNDGWDVTEADDGIDQGMLEVDVNRVFQIFRTVLIRTHSAYTTLSGFSYSYLGMGNEIGYDAANGFPSGIPLSSKPFTGVAGTHNENSIFSIPSLAGDTTLHLKYIKRADDTWFGKSWLGEIYPDDVYTAQWEANGNLDSGTNTDEFVRVPRHSIPPGLQPTGTSFAPSGRSPEEEGVTAFFNIGTSPSTFHQQWSTGTGDVDMSGNTSMDEGTLLTDGLEIADNYNLPVPSTTKISRPFRMSSGYEGKAPDHFENATHNTGYTTASVASAGVQPTGTLSASFYNHELGGTPPYIGSGLITLKETISGVDTGATYVSMNGIDKTGEAGTVFIGKWSMLTLIHSFLSAGLETTSAARIRELPRIFISPFADSALLSGNLPVTWIMSWLRWDGERYIDAYPTTFSEDTLTNHVLMFSSDGGTTWKYAADNTTVVPSLGVRPTSTGLWTQSDVNFGSGGNPVTLNWTWTGSGAFVEGSYLMRMEVYRKDIPLHYSYHQRRIFLKR